MTKRSEEFEKFSGLTKRLLSVPKAEIDKRHEKWKKEKDRKHKPKKSSERGVSRDSGVIYCTFLIRVNQCHQRY
jgi:hypothetical protein